MQKLIEELERCLGQHRLLAYDGPAYVAARKADAALIAVLEEITRRQEKDWLR